MICLGSVIGRRGGNQGWEVIYSVKTFTFRIAKGGQTECLIKKVYYNPSDPDFFWDVDSLQKGLEEKTRYAVTKGNMLYPSSRVNVKTFAILANSRIYNQENLFLGVLLKYCLALTKKENGTGTFLVSFRYPLH